MMLRADCPPQIHDALQREEARLSQGSPRSALRTTRNVRSSSEQIADPLNCPASKPVMQTVRPMTQEHRREITSKSLTSFHAVSLVQSNALSFRVFSPCRLLFWSGLEAEFKSTGLHVHAELERLRTVDESRKNSKPDEERIAQCCSLLERMQVKKCCDLLYPLFCPASRL